MSSTALEFGLISTFRTGNVILDTLICMVIPVVIQRITQHYSLTTLWNMVLDWFEPATPGMVMRQIEITQRFNDGGKIWDHLQKNHMLQKAISLYLADTLDFKGKSAQCELVEKPKTKTTRSTQHGTLSVDDADDARSISDSSSDGYGDANYDEETHMYRGELFRLFPQSLPPLNEWVDVEPGVEFMHEVAVPEGTDKNKNKKSKVTDSKVIFWFRSSLPDGSKRIDALIGRAFAKYQDDQRHQNKSDKDRYFYIQSGTKSARDEEDAYYGDGDSGGGGGDASTAVVAYKRYALSEDKSFANLFFPEKPSVLQLLDDFMNHTGKFAIRGFPYKLGFLLHGPPGTGKTSLIKAVAQYTKRHIVTINLSKIKTNQELLDAVFDLKFAIDGQDEAVELSFKDVVFVMEDIDCAASVVNSREEQEKREAKRLLKIQQRQEKKHKNKHKKTKSKKKKSKKSSDSESDSEDSDEDDDSDDDDEYEVRRPKMKMGRKPSDKLNLSGLLNVLDGVIDSPGRIVIMTTNHPEKLDPALIRPGRVNKKLLLDYIQQREMQEMIEYYGLTKLSTGQQTRLGEAMAENATNGKRLSPAEIEELCAEHDDVDSVLDRIATSA